MGEKQTERIKGLSLERRKEKRPARSQRGRNRLLSAMEDPEKRFQREEERRPETGERRRSRTKEERRI